MLKRKNDSNEDSQFNSKFRNISTILEDTKLIDTQYRIPVEMITKIISNLTDIEDLKCCMSLSREVRQEIFKTPEVMKKIKYVADCKNLKYFKERRMQIRCLRIKMQEADSRKLRLILSNTPNLEDLTLEINNTYLQLINHQKSLEVPDLSKLKALKISIYGLEILLKNSKNIKNLEKLTIVSDINSSYNHLEELITQQNSKHKLQLIFNDEAYYSSLKNFEPFGDYMRSLELRNLINPDTRQVQFDRFKNLTKITCLTFNLTLNHMYHPQYLKIPSVTSLECKTGIITSRHLKLLDLMLPNLKNLKCEDIDAREGCCDKLLNLEINYLSFHSFQHSKFPNLKNLTVNFSWGLFQNEFWKNSVENLPNVENVSICGYFSEIEARFVIPHVKGFKNLKNFKFIHKNNVNCKVIKDQILIDRTKGAVTLSKYIIQNYKQVVKIVYENFVGYKILEII